MRGRIKKLVGTWLMLMNGVMKRPQYMVQTEKPQRVEGKAKEKRRMNKIRTKATYFKHKTNRESSKEKG